MTEKESTKKILRTLMVVLCAQLGLVALVYWQGQNNRERQIESLFTIEANQVAGILLTSRDDDGIQELVIKKSGDDWRLPNYLDLPVEQQKLGQFLQNILNLQSAWPVATSKDSAERFEVNQDNFKKQVVLKDKNEQSLANIYFGTSPGFRKVHLRLADQDAIYAIEFNQFDASAEAKDWLDKTVLQPQQALQRLQLRDIDLNYVDDKWQLATLSSENQSDVEAANESSDINAADLPAEQAIDEIIDTVAVDKLLEDITRLRVMDVADIEQQQQLTAAEPVATVGITLADQSQHGLRFYALDDEYFVIYPELYTHYFRVNKAVIDRLSTISRINLLKKSPDLINESAKQEFEPQVIGRGY